MRYIVSLIFLEVALFFTNYTSGSSLIGWDSIMPEFNLPLNFQRAISSLWQEYRGLGLVDGMAHAANLFHTISIFILSLILPQSILRYVYIHLTHLIGGLALFFLVGKLTENKKAAFLGSLLYMFNLGVMQMYYAPLEVFATHFATLPLLALLTQNALHIPRKKNFLFLFLGALFTTPQAFVPTVFLASCLVFFSLLFVFYLSQKNLKLIFLVGMLFLSANAFWLFTYLYSALYTPQIIVHTRINEFSSEEIFYRNKARGDLLSVLFMKGFMLDSIEYDTKNHRYVYFMDAWRNHQASILYNIIFLLILMITALGIGKMIRQKNIQALPYFFSIVAAFFFLANDTFILDLLNSMIRNLFPLFGEAFRFPFTKFITLFVFCFCMFFSFGLASALQRVKRFEKQVFIGTALALLFLAYPAFLGNFTSVMLRLKVPNEYLRTFEYFTMQDSNKRIALLPAHTFWNWQYRDWGYRGSGFLWYGIKQPILKRAFDPWSNYNEQFYNELAYAINSQNLNLFSHVLKKYDISYLLLDEHVINITSNQLINYSGLKKFLETNQFIKKKQNFGKLTIYEANNTSPWIYTFDPLQTKRISAGSFFDNADIIFNREGNYVEDKKNPNTIYPFPSLYTERLQEDIPFTFQNTNLHLFLTTELKQLPKNQSYTLDLPSLFSHEFLIPVSIELKNNLLTLTPIYPKITIDNKEIAVDIDPIVIKPTAVHNPDTITFEDIEYTVSFEEPQQKSYLLNKYPNVLRLTDGKNEELVVVDTRGVAANPMQIALTNTPSLVKIGIEKFDNPFNQENIIDKKQYALKSSIENSILHPFPKNYASVAIDPTTGGITLSAKTDAEELTFYKDNLFHQASYLLLTTIQYKSGLPINFSIDNPFQNRLELETRLSKKREENFVILPPRENYFKGYGFHFVVKSVGKEVAQSTINTIDLYPMPVETIKNIKILRVDEPSISGSSSEKKQIKFEKINTFLYKASFPKEPSYLVLSQSFAPGWKAYEVFNNNFFTTTLPFLFGQEVKNHVLVNNWANGWVLSNETMKQLNNETIIIIFWPQYLEYGGFLLSVVSLLLVILYKKKYTT